MSGLVTTSTPVIRAVRGVVAELRDEVAEPKQRTVTTTGPIFAASPTLINETERRLRSKEHNRADWRSTLRYAPVTQCTPNCDINRLRTPQQRADPFGHAAASARPLPLSLTWESALRSNDYAFKAFRVRRSVHRVGKVREFEDPRNDGAKVETAGTQELEQTTIGVARVHKLTNNLKVIGHHLHVRNGERRSHAAHKN